MRSFHQSSSSSSGSPPPPGDRAGPGRSARGRDYYSTSRNLDAAGAADSVDLGPEGVLFIEGEDSPTREPLLVVTHEITGTTTIFGLG